ncbi:MAG: sigma-70 family RNA polymerase sigma factor [Sedimentisphaerales bacterium]|nr:sigma-70 family RNA polymerase sigma factor [Sedimentisphaerales bacterium]
MSGSVEDTVELARKAQLGDTESLNRLAEAARVRLHEYVFRLTLQEDLTQDIVQETILEMLRIFENLRRREKFWPWLYGIAFNKVRNHYGKRWRQKTRCFSEVGYEPRGAGGGDALAEAVTAELRQIVLQCIGELEPRHRAVLSMRCYDQMSYAQIARLMHRSEIAVRALFYRAKKALARRLSAHGLGRHSLLLALVVFGKVTATSEAAAAQVSVTAPTVTVGPLAALVALLTGKATVITALSAAALIAGSVTVGHYRAPGSVVASRFVGSEALPAAPWTNQPGTAEQECWHYFPQGPDGAVMTRLLEYDSPGATPCCRILENQYANYHYDHRQKAVRIDNHRAWKPDLSVKRLPTDSAALSEFIAQVEGRPSDMELTASGRSGLLILCKRQGRKGTRIWRIERRINALAEEYFQHSWPESTRTVDRRDAMHQRGWTYFRIDGELNGTPISGNGRMPFVYAARAGHAPWLKLRVGGNLLFVDTPEGAHIAEGHDRIAVRYPGGSFFKGLGRPWLGLHCIDTIRRDAAERQLRFETAYDADTGYASVTVHAEPLDLVYTVDMETDVIKEIVFLRKATQGTKRIGELHFDYIQDIDRIEDSFAAPPRSVSAGVFRHEPGMLWLSQLAEER